MTDRQTDSHCDQNSILVVIKMKKRKQIQIQTLMIISIPITWTSSVIWVSLHAPIRRRKFSGSSLRLSFKPTILTKPNKIADVKSITLNTNARVNLCLRMSEIKHYIQCHMCQLWGQTRLQFRQKRYMPFQSMAAQFLSQLDNCWQRQTKTWKANKL